MALENILHHAPSLVYRGTLEATAVENSTDQENLLYLDASAGYGTEDGWIDLGRVYQIRRIEWKYMLKIFH